MADFWNARVPCWDFLECPKNIFPRCSAYHNKDKPCWEQEITECRKVLDFEWKCEDCRVFIYYKLLVPRISRNKQNSIPNHGIDRQLKILRSKLRRIFDPWEEQTIRFCSLTPRQAAGNALAGGFNTADLGV